MYQACKQAEVVGNPKLSHLDGAQGNNEQRASRTNLYGERAAQEVDTAIRQEPRQCCTLCLQAGRGDAKLRGMAESIEELLKKRNYSEPEEISIIRNFVFRKYGKVPGLKIAGKKIIISVPSAALAGALRMDLHELSKKTKTKHELTIQIRR